MKTQALLAALLQAVCRLLRNKYKSETFLGLSHNANLTADLEHKDECSCGPRLIRIKFSADSFELCLFSFDCAHCIALVCLHCGDRKHFCSFVRIARV